MSAAQTRRRALGALAVGACALAGLTATSGTSEAAKNGPTMDIQILSFNDFHGNLEPPSGSSGRIVTGHTLDGSTPAKALDVTKDVGGVEYLATHLKQARVGHPNTLTVAAGDIIGASPLLSAAFHDEPTIEAMNTLGLDVTAVGNHEFDEGYQELLRMQRGGCLDDGAGANNQDSCAAHTFQGANFDFLAANVKYATTPPDDARAASSKQKDKDDKGKDKGDKGQDPKKGDTILPAYSIKNVNGAKIGFIGMTLKDTPSIVTAAGIAGLEFTDEVATANALVPELRKKGVNAIVVLIHQGGTPDKQLWTGPDGKQYSVNPSYNYTCDGGGSLVPASSPILGIAANLDPAIDMVVSGHTHQPYTCNVTDPAGQPRLLTSASSFGRLFTETNLTYDRRTQDIVRASVTGTNMLVTRDVPKDAAETALIGQYKRVIAPIASKVVGHINADVTRTGNPAGESALGDLIADAQLADPSTVTGGQKPVVAFMNPGGIRSDLTAAASSWGEASGDVTYEEAFTVQPFNNYLVSMTLTGQSIYDLLAQQVVGSNAASKKTLQVSKGFTYTMSPTGPVEGSVKIGSVPVDKAASYRIVTNNFLADGGDNFPAFRLGTARYFGGLDIDAFATYLPTVSPFTPAPPTRVGGSL